MCLDKQTNNEMSKKYCQKAHRQDYMHTDIDETGCHGANIPDLKHCPFTKGCILGDLKLILEPHVFNSMFDNDHSIRGYKWRAMSSMPYNENGWIVSRGKGEVCYSLCNVPSYENHFSWGNQTIDREEEKNEREMQKETRKR